MMTDERRRGKRSRRRWAIWLMLIAGVAGLFLLAPRLRPYVIARYGTAYYEWEQTLVRERPTMARIWAKLTGVPNPPWMTPASGTGMVGMVLGSGPGMSYWFFRHVELPGADLPRAPLAGANLEAANLRGANLARANLRRANLGDADLREANLSGAHLNGANLSVARLEGADLRGADLRGADLRGAQLNCIHNMAGTDLRGADLTGSAIVQCEWGGVLMDERTRIAPKYRLAHDLANHLVTDKNLRGVDLSQAWLLGVDLRGCDLTDANLNQCRPGGKLAGAKFFRAKLRKATLTQADLRGADLRKADLQLAALWGADLRHADLTGANLAGANLTGANLAGANLTGAKYDNKTTWPHPGYEPRQHGAVKLR